MSNLSAVPVSAAPTESFEFTLKGGRVTILDRSALMDVAEAC